MFKRFLCVFLALIIVLPLGGNFSKASGLNREIDVLMDSFVLNVEGNNFSHRDVFLYEGDLYVPIGNLSQELGLDIKFDPNSKILELDSRGRLAFDDNSKFPISYQRGYEIIAKERLKDIINSDIGNFLNKVQPKDKKNNSDLKTINVGFSNMEILLDGQNIYPGGETFMYNNDIYLPLTNLSPYLYITPVFKSGNVIDIDLNGVLKDKKKNAYSSSYYSIDELVAFRESLNTRYSRELEELNKKKEIIMDVKIPYEEVKSLKDMEAYLNKHLGEIKDLALDISLRAASGKAYSLDIDFSNSYRDLAKWRSLSRRDIEGHVWDIYVAISSLYDQDAKIQGNIKKYVQFDTKMKDLVFSFINSGLDMSEKVDPVFIGELLEKNLNRYRREYFNYQARVSGYDLELIISPSSSDILEKWSPYEQLDYLQRINNEIKRHYPGLKIDGKIVYQGQEDLLFTIDDNKLRSSSIMNNTNDYLDNRYGFLNADKLRIPMSYHLSQVDMDNFKLMVDMDCSINDPKWNAQANEDLVDLIYEVVRELVALWDANIFVEVYDNSQLLAFEHIVSQDTVHIVRASPGQGQVLEGSQIRLTSETLDAKIYYTLDGTRPSTSSFLYSQPIVISQDTSIMAFAVKEGLKDSPTATFNYRVVESDDIASGLSDLIFDKGKLSPKFNTRTLEYNLDLAFDTENIEVTPFADKGSISINGRDVKSQESLSIDPANTKTIRIVHKEDGKSQTKTYTIHIKIGDQEGPIESNVKLASYDLNLSIYGVFTGKLSGDYEGHRIRLLSDIGKEHGQSNINPDGSFEISGFDIDPITKWLGYKYEILDKDEKVVDDGPLKE